MRTYKISFIVLSWGQKYIYVCVFFKILYTLEEIHIVTRSLFGVVQTSVDWEGSGDVGSTTHSPAGHNLA